MSFVWKRKFGLDVVELERICRRDRPDEFALPQHQSVHLQLPVQQRVIIQLQLEFGNRKHRAGGSFCVADADIFRDDPTLET